MAKRSPILGYNHNVRYRGLVFHVQTEDSGVLSPHLFTHLFHGGVIVSTRKLVYDAGSNEEVIKTLMQAQHKAVLKELKKGLFDDKIDLYLGGTPGLLPSAAGADPSTPAAPRPPVVPDPALGTKPTQNELTMSRANTEADPPPVLALKPTDLAVKTPPEDDATRPTAAPPAVAVGRAPTAERRSARSSVRTNLPTEPPGSGSPDSIAAAVAAANQVNATVRTAMLADDDSSPEIEIELEADEPDGPAVARSRSVRDTDIAAPFDLMPGDDHTRPTVDVSTLSDGIPGVVGHAGTPRPGGSIPPPPSTPRRNTPNAVGASALPPARPITRPPSRPAITPPQVVSRPLPPEERRRRETDAIEVYAPAPPSVEAPPGMADRGGQYSQHKKTSQRIPAEAIKGERPQSGSVPIPPGLGRPGQLATPPSGVPKAQPPPIPQAVRQSERSPGQPPGRPRTLTPARISSTAPAQSRTGSTGTGGVVMTRPAVIVGAPAKPAQPRVRKAREDEGRGFGQGLISEKSLDEVILAYLSEDAEEK